MAGRIRWKQSFLCSSLHFKRSGLLGPTCTVNVTAKRCINTTKSTSTKTKKTKKEIEIRRAATEMLVKKEKRRTRSSREYEFEGCGEPHVSHMPVMLGEVVDVFSFIPVRSFVDCTLGAAGHSSAIIRNHPELRHFIGMDVDPAAHKLARVHLDSLLHSSLNASIVLKNFKSIKSVLAQVDTEILDVGVDGILMDLGMSSMQVNNHRRGFSVLQEGSLDMRMDPQISLKAEDILNSWPESEVGRVIREYGEESNWRLLQNKIVKARLNGGLRSTRELVDLIRSTTLGSRGGRQGWIKTATRVFQGLRIAVNDELKTLEDSLYLSFECLAPGGRLAVISFHSLEDRIVKQTFLDIVDSPKQEISPGEEVKNKKHIKESLKESWIKQTVQGSNGIILTKRPITPSENEEKLNRRSRSAKLRVIQKF